MGPRTGAENLVSTGIRSSDRAARSESPYRLSYPGPLTIIPNVCLYVSFHSGLAGGQWRKYFVSCRFLFFFVR